MDNHISSSLLSSHKSSDSGLHAHLHPLVLLTISDYITRHTLRRRQIPIVGALLGQQTGRDISLEHAFECDVVHGDQDTLVLNEVWFKERLQQYKDVHKAPVLELVGWFTATPTSGPATPHVAIHRQILNDYNETAILLAFHPSAVLNGAAMGGKLPLTIYESVYESIKSDGPIAGDADVNMEIEGQEALQDSQLDLRFRELPYSVETGEAEMISVDFVARGGGIATEDGNIANGKGQSSQVSAGKADSTQVESQTDAKLMDESALSAEDEELIASLSARANAIKMLHNRIQLLKSYLTNLPPSYLTILSQPGEPCKPQDSNYTEINHPILRSVQALLNRLPLLLPADQTIFEQEILAEKSNVSLVDLLATATSAIKDARELGRKFSIVESMRQASTKRHAPGLMADDLSMYPLDKADAPFPAPS